MVPDTSGDLFVPQQKETRRIESPSWPATRLALSPLMLSKSSSTLTILLLSQASNTVSLLLWMYFLLLFAELDVHPFQLISFITCSKDLSHSPCLIHGVSLCRFQSHLHWEVLQETWGLQSFSLKQKWGRESLWKMEGLPLDTLQSLPQQHSGAQVRHWVLG